MTATTITDPKATVLPLLEGSTWPNAAEALAQVNALPIPGTRTEAWKYTRVGKLFNQNYSVPNAAATVTLPVRLPFDVTRIVFVNGHFRADLSDDLNRQPEQAPLPRSGEGALWRERSDQRPALHRHERRCTNRRIDTLGDKGSEG